MLPYNSELDNPLLPEVFNTQYETVPFQDIDNEHFLPAFDQALKQGKKEIDLIANNDEPPDFQNTIKAIDKAPRLLDRVSGVFFNLNHAETSERMQEIARIIAPKLSDFENDIIFNQSLFKRVKSVYEKRKSLNLSTEQGALLEKVYLRFFRNGVSLEKNLQEKLREITRELSKLSLQFDDNVLAETNEFHLHIEDEKELAGLPLSVRESAAHEAKKMNIKGWVFTLHAPSYWPFMKYADNRQLREKIFRAMGSRGFKDNKHNNTKILKKIANLRLEKAILLGYQSHAHFVLEERMAKTPDTVQSFLNRLINAAKPIALNDIKEVQQQVYDEGGDFLLQYWDWWYYAEKLKKKKFDFDEEQVRPYFELKKVRKGAFALAARLWGLSFIPTDKIQVYNKDVEAYIVFDGNGSFLSILYLDFFPRKGKSPGAWMTSYREQEVFNGTNVRPHVSLVFNFPKPTATEPSLLNFGELSTYLHEFGHALHGMMSNVNYSSLSGTNVYRDFVELPSQFLENWATEPDFINMFARHYVTGEPLPKELIDKFVDLRKFNAAFNTMRQVSYGIVDMAWHSIMQPVKDEPRLFEYKVTEPIRLLPDVAEIMISSAFSHIFAGGYAAGYYSYKWAEVLDADAFNVFKENGIFDQKTAEKFRENILSKGGSEEPMELYKRYRGKEPDVEAMLKRDGLKENVDG